MSRETIIRFAALPGTQAGAGRLGAHHVVADRPEGVAGGLGLGPGGAELLAAALGGSLWNDLHLVAERMGHRLLRVEVDVHLTLAGAPPRAVRARLVARLAADPAAAARPVFDAAAAESMVAHSVMAAFPVAFELADRAP